MHPQIAAKVQITPEGCWVWTGKRKPSGYGVAWRNGGEQLAHRASYELHVGPIPAGLHLDHLCRNRACVNPSHLEPVTNAENHHRACKTHCPKGHPYDEANTHIDPRTGNRYCRTCRSEYGRAYQPAYRARTREQKNAYMREYKRRWRARRREQGLPAS